MTRSFKLLVPLLGVVLASSAFGREVEGVILPDTVTAGDKTLRLNGAGLRKRFLFKVYVAALYLETPTRDGAQILGSDTVRQVRLVMLRDVDRAKLQDAVKKGFDANGTLSPALQAKLTTFLGHLRDVREGEQLIINYVPGRGTSVMGGKDVTTIEGKDFADALFSVWIGKHPVDESLRRGMLGT